jgi:hypothetical protein
MKGSEDHEQWEDMNRKLLEEFDFLEKLVQAETDKKVEEFDRMLEESQQ